MEETYPQILVGANEAGEKLSILGRMANRHGLIAGATGTGKTVTLQVLAEGFSRLGVPVFTADIKGDLSGLGAKGIESPKIDARVQKIGISDFNLQRFPVLFWDVYSKNGHPVRATISEMGPLLLSELLELNETQSGVIQIAFRVADDEGLLLLDLKDLRAMLTWLSEHASEVSKSYGNVTSSSIAAIQRRLLVLEEAGGEQFFGEPVLSIEHLMQRDFNGNGVISILDATKLLENGKIYAIFLLWLLSELFENLDEVGDQELPRVVFFFDEAHLLFQGAPKPLVDKIEQVVRLIRSKGVGIYFITQNPLDIPDAVASQLGNRIQHGLRAFTPNEQKAVKAAANTFRQNPDLDTTRVITELSIGEALVSVLEADGKPSIVQKLLICPPSSKIGPISDLERKELIGKSPIKGLYDQTLDRESAFELLKQREAKRNDSATTKAPNKSRRQSPLEAFVKSMLRSIGSQIGRQIVRGILGSIKSR